MAKNFFFRYCKIQFILSVMRLLNEMERLCESGE